MINRFINSIPSKNTEDIINQTNKYYNYILEKISNEDYQIKNKPDLKIVWTPELESFFFHKEENSTILLCVGLPVLCDEMYFALAHGVFLKELWLELISFGCNILLPFEEYRNIIMNNILNQRRIFEEEINTNDNSIEKVIQLGKNNEAEKYFKYYNSPLMFFILSHEICHHSIEFNKYDKSKFKKIIKNILQNPDNDIEHKEFYRKIVNNPKYTNFENIEEELRFRDIRKVLFSKSFETEIICDLLSIDFTFDYFTWDVHNFEIANVGNSIKVLNHTIFILSELKNKILNGYGIGSKINLNEIYLRMNLIEIYIDSKIRGYINNDKYFLFLSQNNILKLRSYSIINFLNDEIIQKMNEMDSKTMYPEGIFRDFKATCLYYQGFDNNVTKSDLFLSTDGLIMSIYKSGFDGIKKLAEIDYFYISKQTKDKISTFLTRLRLF